MKRFLLLLMLGILLVLPLVAGPVRVSFRDTTVLRGSTVYIPVYVDSSLTGLNVYSYQLEVTFTSSVLSVDSAICVGTMTEGWGIPSFHLSSGRITIAGAGGDSLFGTGVLVYLKVNLPTGPTGTYASLQFVKALFNEGSPTTTTRNGTITITNPPVITIYPNTALLTTGETQQFNASGGTPPYTWSTTDPSIATVNTTGLLTAGNAGICRVVAIDNQGYTDTTSAIEVRAFKLTIRDTSARQGQTISLPIYVTDLSGVDVYSGMFTVSYNQNLITPLGTEQSGTLMQSLGAPAMHVGAGQVTIAFADTTPLVGSGTQVLVYLRLKLTETGTGSTSLQFSDVLFNENLPGNVRNGYLTVQARGLLTVSPNTATLVAGDSLHFSVTSAYTSPLSWSVSDTALASISSAGWLKVRRGGSIHVIATDSLGATGSSGVISLYDTRIQIPTVNGRQGDTVEVPIQVGAHDVGIYSAQFTLSFNATYFTAVSVVSAGTLFDGGMIAMGTPTAGSVVVSAARAEAVTTDGMLLKIRLAISGSTPLGSYPINITGALLNEGNPIGLISNGHISVGPMDVGDKPNRAPGRFELHQNYPNPFNPSTDVRYGICDVGFVSLKVYDVLGREVATLVNEVKQPGEYTVRWNAGNYPSGVYFYRLQSRPGEGGQAGSFSQTRKLILMK